MTTLVVILTTATLASSAAALFFFLRSVNDNVKIKALTQDKWDFHQEVVDLEQANNELLEQILSLKQTVLERLPKTTLPQPNGWTPDNCLALNKFLKSDTGHALMQRGRAMEFNRAISNARAGTEHAAGMTVGITETFNWIESLASDEMFKEISRPSGEQDGNHTTDGEQDDAALVERYSP